MTETMKKREIIKKIYDLATKHHASKRSDAHVIQFKYDGILTASIPMFALSINELERLYKDLSINYDFIYACMFVLDNGIHIRAKTAYVFSC